MESPVALFDFAMGSSVVIVHKRTESTFAPLVKKVTYNSKGQFIL